MKTDMDMRRRTRADTHQKKTTGESSTDKQRCDDCGQWFVNLSNHCKCSGRSRTVSSTEVRDASQPDDSTMRRRTPRTGTTRKDVLKHKALQPKEKMLQVSDILITAIEIHN